MSNRRLCLHPVRQRTGFALILVLVAVAMLTLSTYTFTRLMITENESALIAGQQLQARAMIDSGVAHVRYLLELDPVLRQDLGGSYDNAQLFQAQLIADQGTPASRAHFGVVAPRMDDQGRWGGLRFGLQDESSRLNLNALNLDIDAGANLDEIADAENDDNNSGEDSNENSSGDADDGGEDDSATEDAADLAVDTSGRAMLLGLPGMTIEVADAILDWIDDDDESREYGAEADYYAGLTPPYVPQNGPLQSIEELLLVRGVSADLLFGRDINRNGIIDMQESELPLQFAVDPGDGSTDFGWSAYLTLFSQEKNVTRLGEPRINLNAQDMEQLHDELSGVMEAAWVTYIVAYRQNGPYRGKSEDAKPAGEQSLDLTKPGKEPIKQVLDLIGGTVQAQLEGGSKPVIIKSPFSEGPESMAQYASELLDLVTANPAKTIPGRINVNEAPRTVLLAVPGMTEQIADGIISQRDPQNSEFQETLQHETWLMSQGIVTLKEMKTLSPFVTAGGDVYRAQIVGYFDGNEVSARAEVVFDATTAMPRILSWKDISHLGRGYARQTLGVDLQNMSSPYNNSQSTFGNSMARPNSF